MRISIQTSYPQLELANKLAQIKVNKEYPKAYCRYSGPEIKIEQQSPMNEIGMGDHTHFTRQLVKEAQHEVFSGIARRSQEGDRAVKQMTAQDVFITLAKEKIQAKTFDYNVDIAPKSRPEIDFNYDLEIDWQLGGTDIQFQLFPLDIKWQIGEVKVSTIGNYIDTKG